jgi:hypothetical protein
MGQVPRVGAGGCRGRRGHEPYGRSRTLRGARAHATRRRNTVQGSRGNPFLTCDLGRLNVGGNLDQEPGSGYGDYWHVVLLRVLHESHLVPGYR